MPCSIISKANPKVVIGIIITKNIETEHKIYVKIVLRNNYSHGAIEKQLSSAKEIEPE